ncbi:unnamed protein product [Bathycoccus prasinos]
MYARAILLFLLLAILAVFFNIDLKSQYLLSLVLEEPPKGNDETKVTTGPSFPLVLHVSETALTGARLYGITQSPFKVLIPLPNKSPIVRVFRSNKVYCFVQKQYRKRTGEKLELAKNWDKYDVAKTSVWTPNIYEVNGVAARIDQLNEVAILKEMKDEGIGFYATHDVNSMPFGEALVASFFERFPRWFHDFRAKDEYRSVRYGGGKMEMAPHWDPSWQIIVQLSGKRVLYLLHPSCNVPVETRDKRWDFRQACKVSIRLEKVKCRHHKPFRIVLTPGKLVYIPKKWYHSINVEDRIPWVSYVHRPSCDRQIKGCE